MTEQEFFTKVEKLSPQDGDLLVAHHDPNVPHAQVSRMMEILRGVSASLRIRGKDVAWLLLPTGLRLYLVDPESMRRLGWVREEEAKRREKAAREAVGITPLRSIKFVSQSRPEYASLYQALEGVFLEDALAEGVAVARKLNRSIVLDFGHEKIVITPTSDPARLFERFRYRPVDYVADGQDGFEQVGATPVAPDPVANPFDRDSKRTSRNDMP